MTYLATINTPGYMPWDDDPPVFDTAKEAWEYLADHRIRAFEDAALDGDGVHPELDTVKNTLESLGNGTLDYDDAGLSIDGTGAVSGSTPGYEGDHDLGLIYSVTEVE